MNWNQKQAEGNWIHLGYLAANAASVLIPISRGEHIDLSERDQSLLRQQAAFFNSAVTGLSSFDQPSLLFQTEENVVTYPASALDIAIAIYSLVQGGPIADPAHFKCDLIAYGDTLGRLAEGEAVGDLNIAKEVATFLSSLVDHARGELRHPTSNTH